MSYSIFTCIWQILLTNIIYKIYKYNATLLKTGQNYMLNNKTVGKLYYPDRVVQWWVSEMMLNVHSDIIYKIIYIYIILYHKAY